MGLWSLGVEKLGLLCFYRSMIEISTAGGESHLFFWLNSCYFFSLSCGQFLLLPLAHHWCDKI